MQITPFVGDTVVSSDTVTIRINPSDRERADDLVLRTSTIAIVRDERTFRNAREALGQLKSMLNEISDSEKGAKRPFSAIVNAIGQLAKDVGTQVKDEHERIQRLCSHYVAKLEAEKYAKRDAQRKAQAEAEQKITEARKRAALAQTENEKLRSQLALAQAELDRQTIVTAAQSDEQKSLVPGGRVDHPWRFELVDPKATVAAGGIRLLRIELDILACQDCVRAQLETNPDRVPTLPGITVSRETKVSVKATAPTE
jgi:hypothetical protein